MDQSKPPPPDPPQVKGVSADAPVVSEQDRSTARPLPESSLPESSLPESSSAARKVGERDPHHDRFVVEHIDSWRGDLLNVVRGFCMGLADAVPGISGGTIALIMGHYSRLVTAISRFDLSLLGLIRKRQLREASEHIELRFLVPLGCGLVVGFVTSLGSVHHLLETRLPETLAVFLGLLLASLWVVVQYVDRWSLSRIAACAGGIIVAAGVSALPSGQGNLSLPFLFLAGSIAICAMILPGISGAYVLLVLGVYQPVSGLVKNLLKLQYTFEGLVQLAVFAAGCIFGMLSFSRLLRRLLKQAPGVTMAALMGLMIGSVGKLWPLQLPTAETADLEPKFRVMRYVAPSQWEGSIALLVGLAVASAAIVLSVEWIATKRKGVN